MGSVCVDDRHKGEHVSGQRRPADIRHRVNNVVINRCRKPADADIPVPGDTISPIGTTSSRIPIDQVDRM